MKKLSLLGSTGSIGTQTLNVVRRLSRDGGFPVNDAAVKIVALSAHSNIELLEAQAREFEPEVVSVFDESAAKAVKIKLADTNIKVLSGISGLCEAAAWESADTTLNSVTGMIGLRPTLEAISAKKDIALANKETLVAAGALVMAAVKENSVRLLPVDSEHSAIFQCLEGSHDNKLKKILLTASGGPFFGKTPAELEEIKPQDALKHPNWSMGAKITIDSATMMNKGLEVIEAAWLFGVPVEQVEVLVHRESIVHSMVEFADNSVIAQLGVPDMGIPIQYALTYPERFPSPAAELDLTEIGNLTFYKPDYNNFKCLPACIEAGRMGGLAPAMVNGANEEAVRLFLEGRISFAAIGDIAEEMVKRANKRETYALEDVLEADEEARGFARSLI